MPVVYIYHANSNRQAGGTRLAMGCRFQLDGIEAETLSADVLAAETIKMQVPELGNRRPLVSPHLLALVSRGERSVAVWQVW